MGLSNDQKKERSEYLEKYLEITECSQKKPYVFISYASDNWEAVFKNSVIPLQKQYGLSVYADKAFDKLNDKWIVPMLRNIRGSDVVVAFISQSYIESYACFLELLTAINNRKPLVFVSVEYNLHLGDTTDQPEVERGAKNEILNQGANIATNTNNSSNDLMRAIKSAYTSISTLLEQDALSKYDISDAFINFFRDASINSKNIEDLNGVRLAIWATSEYVFDRSLIAGPVAAPIANAMPQQQAMSQPAVQQYAPQQQYTPQQQYMPQQPVPQHAPKPEKKGKKPFMKVLIGAAALLIAAIGLFVLLGGRSVTDKPYTMTAANSETVSGMYTGDWDKWNKYPSGNGTFTLNDDGGTYEGAWANGAYEGQGTLKLSSGDTYEGEWIGGARNGKGKRTYPDGSIYDGEWKDNKREGNGSLTWLNDKGDGNYVYEGTFTNDARSGKGKLTYPNGAVFEGDFVDGWPNGKGICKWTNGEIYEGEVKDGIISGKGKITYANGDSYEGGFKDNYEHGDGVYTFADGSKENVTYNKGVLYVTDMKYTNARGTTGTYTGGWNYQNKWPEGQGAIKYDNGDVLEGEFKDGEAVNGKVTYANGGIYEGEFANGYCDGKGKMTYGEESQILEYDGEWKNGYWSGKGIAKWKNGEIYDGEWLDSKRNGQGKETYTDGNTYEGEWKDDNRNGYGIYTWADGRIFEGEWKDGKQNGKGKYTNTKKETYEGEWIDGKREGEFIYTDASGNKTKQKYKGGNKVE